jgi:hypothetical protein
MVPVPAPTAASTGPLLALRMAANTSSRPTDGCENVVQRSIVSLTDQRVDGTDVFVSGQSEHVVHQASATRGTFRVEVSRIGVSISPSSFT